MWSGKGGRPVGSPAVDDSNVLISPMAKDLPDLVKNACVDILGISTVDRGRPVVQVLKHAQNLTDIFPTDPGVRIGLRIDKSVVQRDKVLFHDPRILAP